MNKKKNIVTTLLIGIICILCILIYRSVKKPIIFENAKNERYEKTIERLKEIRKAQIAYKSVYGKYTASFDTLINFVKTDSIIVIKAVGTIPDTLYMQMGKTAAEKYALQHKLILRDTFKVSARDSLFEKNFEAENMRFVPFFDNKYEFKMQTGQVLTGAKVYVNVLEVSVTNEVLLQGLNKSLLKAMEEEALQNGKFPGLKIGSLSEANNNAGNWE